MQPWKGLYQHSSALSGLWGRLWAGSRVDSLVRGRTSPSEAYPAGKLQLHFTYDFDFSL